MTLEEAQIAKIDLALGKLDLRPGMTLLDIGCGWGSVMKRAVEKYDVNVIGLTLSRNQCTLGQQVLDQVDTDRSRRVLLRGWEEFDEPVDRIVSASRRSRRSQVALQGVLRPVLPASCPAMAGWSCRRSWVTHSSAGLSMGIPITMTDLKFMRFIAKEIFPGGSVPCDEDVIEYSGDAGFSAGGDPAVEPALRADPRHLGPALKARRDEAIAVTSEEVYDRYMRYLIGCSDFFRRTAATSGSSR